MIMNLRNIVIYAMVAMAAMAGCEKNPYGPTGYTPDTEDKDEDKKDTTEVIQPEEPVSFAKGADISWVTQMEEDGVTFYNADGQEKECTELMKELGFNAIRLRVWVNPEDGWCNKEDVLEKAFRASNLGMRLMIDFHYSDSWADPSKQNPPSAWKSYDAVQMAEAVASHTIDVLKSMKEVGIEVDWVQIGNEVNSGMLHPLGKVSGNDAVNFVNFVNAGYKSVKEIYPDAKVIIHVSNGQDKDLFGWFFGLMKSHNARYDMIGMSLYPVWWENNGWTAWKPVVDNLVTNIESLVSKFGKPVMVCEVGLPVSEPKMSKDAIQYILDKTRKIEGCHGIFMWEPQTDGVWKPQSYNALGWNAYDKGAFKEGKATIAFDPFKE